MASRKRKIYLKDLKGTWKKRNHKKDIIFWKCKRIDKNI